VGRSRRRRLAALVQERWPLDPDAVAAAIAAGDVLVDGRPRTNPDSLIAADAAVRFSAATDLQGRRKLAWAIDYFRVVVKDTVALDLGACTGGFTTALLDAGAALVYAVDAGHGQLLGSLRQHGRVVNLERTNVSALNRAVVPVALQTVSVDVSYLSLSSAVAQINGLDLSPGAQLLGLVKPMFELRLPTIPQDSPTLERARRAAVDGIGAAGWTVADSAESPVRGNGGAVEFFVHARR
jgi:23S rRNA (cytidine1920-2'-O)/16S rRNA (cytidine1409-2'-O)-methyltransferase